MKLNNNFMQNFSFSNNFSNIFDKGPSNISKVEEALKPVVSKYGATDEHDFSKVTNSKQTNMDKLQEVIIEEDDTMNALDFVDENGDGIDNIDEEVNSMESLLDGITDEEDLEGIQAELTAMMEEIDKIAQNTYNAVSEIASKSNGITSSDENAAGVNSTFNVSIGNSDVEIQVMEMDSTALGLRDIDVTKEGGLEEAYDIISSASDKISGGLNYLSGVKQEINDTFEDYKAEVGADIIDQLKNYSGDDASDILNQLQSIVIENAGEALLAQMNQEPKDVLALVD